MCYGGYNCDVLGKVIIIGFYPNIPPTNTTFLSLHFTFLLLLFLFYHLNSLLFPFHPSFHLFICCVLTLPGICSLLLEYKFDIFFTNSSVLPILPNLSYFLFKLFFSLYIISLFFPLKFILHFHPQISHISPSSRLSFSPVSFPLRFFLSCSL